MRPEFTYRHHWQLHDMILWDNRCAMHYRTPVDPKQARVLLRTVIKGEALVPG